MNVVKISRWALAPVEPDASAFPLIDSGLPIMSFVKRAAVSFAVGLLGYAISLFGGIGLV